MKNTFFVIQLGGAQHIVRVGDTLVVNHLEGKIGDKITINDVLLVQDDDSMELGSPMTGYSVSAEIIKHSMGKKVDVFKYKAKARYRKTTGHRQFLTTLKVLKLSKKAAAAEKVVKKDAVIAEKKTVKKVNSGVKPEKKSPRVAAKVSTSKASASKKPTGRTVKKSPKKKQK